MKNIEYDNFIGFYRNVFPVGYCQHLIQQMDVLEKQGVGRTRQEEGSFKHVKDDYHIFINVAGDPLNDFENQNTKSIFYEGLQKCFNEYSEMYSSLKHISLRSVGMKMQKTYPGGGYHVWHCEQGEDDAASRAIVYLLYLNGLSPNDGGETEFLYQRMRIKPEENLMLFWPASYTHTHRGNLLLGNMCKYVVTGWFHCQ